MQEHKKIRIAIVRCDTHGYYYGTLIAPCDPVFILKHNKIVHYYATDWYDEKRDLVRTALGPV